MTKKPPGFWHTIPGILTAIAAVVSAVTGLIIVLQKVPTPNVITEITPLKVEVTSTPEPADPASGDDRTSTPIPEVTAAATIQQVALERTSFRLPDDGISMNNARVGPFCCTGKVVIVRSTDSNPVGYIYFFSWEGQAHNVGGGSIVPDLAVLVSGSFHLGDPDSQQIKNRIPFYADRLTTTQSAWVQAGALQYRATVLDFELERGPESKPYFKMGSLKVRVDVKIENQD